ncbi:MAG: glycosyl transferase family 2, partial [Armatimonadota bacterium]|nr:glycosyl transferase family 2 [Armatimonadota bacterium]
FMQAGGRTTVPLEFPAHGSLFVVFRRPIGRNTAGRAAINFPQLEPVQELTGPWSVHLDPKWGGPASVDFNQLDDWSVRPEAGIKYYSGTATYVKQFSRIAKGLAGARTFLDLGVVKNVAEVKLNGRSLGTVWCAPWRIELPAGLLKAEGNELEIKVANLWPNRLIGDAKLPAEKRLTHTNVNFSPDAPLLPSGLLGPVRIMVERPAATS